jgi:hypothetical protein
MSESTHSDAPLTPAVLGEMDASQHQNLQETVAAEQARRIKFSERLGGNALSDDAPVTAVHIVEDSTGEKSFVVSEGANKGDTIRSDRATVFGLDTPEAELTKLKERKDMNREEWDIFASNAILLEAAISANTPTEEVDNQTEQILSNFTIAAQTKEYSTAMKTAMRLLTLGARRQPFVGTARLSDIAAEGYLSDADFTLLDGVVQEIERFKQMEGYSETAIQQQIAQSVAANVSYRPQGTYSDELTFSLNAYATGATLRSPGESEYYRHQLEQQIAS